MYRLGTALLLGLATPGVHLPSPAPVSHSLPAHHARFWGIEGHRLVARIAAARLDSGPAATAARLLHGAALGEIASWADSLRKSRPNTPPWHYVDIYLTDTSYVPARDCPAEGCVVTALQEQMQLLADRTQTDSVRAEALKWVVHLVGDLHQPLHAGERKDRGGNDLKVTFMGQATNLHWVWDAQLLESFGWTEDQIFDDILRQIAARTDVKRIEGGSVISWVMESHDISRDAVYPGIPPSLELGVDYRDHARPVVMDRLLRGGVRLAAVLNRLLAAG